MIRRRVELEVSRAVEVSEQRLRRFCREEVAQAIESLAPALDSALRQIAQEEVTALAAAEAARTAVSGAIGAAVERGVRKAEVRAAVRREVARLVTETRPAVIDVRVDGGPPSQVDGDSHALLPDLLLALGAGCHVFLVGPAGTGKSTMAQQAAGALGLDFFALSVGPTTPTSKIFGYLDAGGSYHDTPFRRAYQDGGLMLLDELDNGHPGLLTELNQALALDLCAFPDGMVVRHRSFLLVTTGNTYGTGGDRQYVGRQALDAAMLDRLVTIEVPVDEALETRLALAHAPSRPEQAERVLAEVRRLRGLAEEKRLPVIFSPRASINAARLLESGASMAKTMQWCVTRGLSLAHRAALGLTP
jgi:MoxR-like ATPase